MEEAQLLQAILVELHLRTGVDLSRHRPPTIRRRILNRMLQVHAPSLRAYLELLRASEGEAALLLERATIKVSRFYRNPAVFDLLRSRWLPALAATRNGPVSIWSAGCARGEEAYTLAMLLEEAGIPGTIEATDVDPIALDAAREGVYAPEACAELPAQLAERYLHSVIRGGRPALRVGEAIRRRVRFHRHDLAAAEEEQPWGGRRFDLISCRNVVIYFDRAMQERVARVLRRALSDDGLLLLGEAEWPSATVIGSLETLAAKARIFRAMDVPEGV